MPDGLKEWAKVVTDFRMEIGVGGEARLMRDLRRLERERYRLRDITKPLGDGLYELKTTYKKEEYRCLYVYFNDEIVILFCFKKKTQKTPKQYMDLAKSRKSELLLTEVSLGEVTFH